MKPVTGNFTGYRLTGNRLTTLNKILVMVNMVYICGVLDIVGRGCRWCECCIRRSYRRCSLQPWGGRVDTESFDVHAVSLPSTTHLYNDMTYSAGRPFTLWPCLARLFDWVGFMACLLILFSLARCWLPAIAKTHCNKGLLYLRLTVIKACYSWGSLSQAGDKILYLKLSEIMKQTISTMYNSVFKVV